jgi:hypothetical protein
MTDTGIMSTTGIGMASEATGVTTTRKHGFIRVGPVLSKRSINMPLLIIITPSRIYMDVLVTYGGLFCVVRPNMQLKGVVSSVWSARLNGVQ